MGVKKDRRGVETLTFLFDSCVKIEKKREGGITTGIEAPSLSPLTNRLVSLRRIFILAGSLNDFNVRICLNFFMHLLFLFTFFF